MRRCGAQNIPPSRREIDQLDVEVANLKSQVAVLMDALKLNKMPIEGESSVGNSQIVAQNVGQGVALNVAPNAGQGVGDTMIVSSSSSGDERVSNSLKVKGDDGSSNDDGGDEWVSNSLKVKGGDGSGNDDGDDVNASPE